MWYTHDMFSFRNSATHSRYSRFVCEQAIVTGVDTQNWTVSCQTLVSYKDVPDIQWMNPYVHYDNGEGIYCIPEVGSLCLLAWPNDNSPPIILGFLGSPQLDHSPDGTPSSPAAGASDTMDQDPGIPNYRSNRLALQAGDIALRTRDENFVILRRGGVLQLGSTAVCQRIMLPINNWIRDFCENYGLSTPGGDLQWIVDRQEHDPSGQAGSRFLFLMRQYAQDPKASVLVRHFPRTTESSDPVWAWEVVVDPQGIDASTQGYSEIPKYRLRVDTNGNFEELVFGNTDTLVYGNETQDIRGSSTKTVGTTAKISAGTSVVLQAPTIAIDGNLALGSQEAAEPAVLGTQLLAYLTTLAAAVNTAGGGLVIPPPSILSGRVRVAS